MRKDQRSALTVLGLLLLIGLWVLIAIQLLPLLVLLLTGLRIPVAVMRDGIFAASGWSLGNFVSLFSDHGMADALLDSLLIALGSAVLAVFAAASFVFSCTQLQLKAAVPLVIGFVCFRLVPPAALVMPLFVLLKLLGFDDSILGLTAVHTAVNLPFCIWLLYPFFKAIPADLRYAAEIDGLGPWSLFWRIHLPLVMPGLMVAGIFSFLLSWNDFLLALVLAGSDVKTAPLLVNGFMTGFGPDWGSMSAAALVVMVPVFVLSFLLQKHIAGGIGDGAVKS
jgi:multiple sugar transport system permease protein